MSNSIHRNAIGLSVVAAFGLFVSAVAGAATLGADSRLSSEPVLVAQNTAKASKVVRRSVRFMQLGESFAWLPFQVARGGNCYAKGGLDINWIPGPVNAAQAVLALMTNQADVSAIGTNAVLSAIDARRPVVVFGVGAKGETQVLVLRNEVIANIKAKLSVTPSSPIRERVQALKGLNVAANTAGGTVMLALQSALGEFGVDFKSGQLQLQAIDGPAAMYAAMRQRRIDGFIYSPPAPLQAIVDNEGAVWISGGDGDVKSWAGTYASVYATTSRYATDNPEVLKIFIDCAQQASTLIKTNPASAMAMARPFYPQTQDETYRLSFEATRGVFIDGPHSSEKGFQATLDKYNATLSAPIQVTYKRAFEAEPR